MKIMSNRELKCGEFLCQCPPYDCQMPVVTNKKDVSNDFIDEQSDEYQLKMFLGMLEEYRETALYAGVTLTYREFHYLVEKLAKEIEFRKYIKQNLRSDENVE